MEGSGGEGKEKLAVQACFSIPKTSRNKNEYSLAIKDTHKRV